MRYCQSGHLFGAVFTLLLTIGFNVHASPVGDIKLVYVKNFNESYSYFFIVNNVGPAIMTPFSTPTDYLISGIYPAGGKLLEDDEYVVLFGLDTQRDDLVISDITNANTAFTGNESTGFSDSNNNGVPNQVLSWQLPDVFTLEETIPIGATAGIFTFNLDQEVTDFEFWVGGSDDTELTNPNHTMLFDFYGQYDLDAGEYLATFYTQRLTAQKVTIRQLARFLAKYNQK